ncbi:PTS sugar transporter subunit IIA [Vagococcus acidifermentans]|uniref:PTS fructose transporter subunit IIA n=1 Tax=Vagococcus acidifermentans TaxID=564710 RepID=A0A430B357_9ENTE|nr:fructose PTS transporter subunit IIA [Vagococcus acidifermentans]RSU14661.1 PTS fructose transporter subunit IIA [Vagococcus acidifermentans]
MINQEHIFLNQQCASQSEMFDFLAKTVVSLGYGKDESQIKDALIRREREGTTGMMDGFAIPHAKSPAISSPTVIVVTNDMPLEWQSMDGEKIRIVIGLFIPESEAGTTHLQMLSKISRMLMNAEKKQLIKEATNKETILSVIQESIAK